MDINQAPSSDDETSQVVTQHRDLDTAIEAMVDRPSSSAAARFKKIRLACRDEILRRARAGDAAALEYAIERQWMTAAKAA